MVASLKFQASSSPYPDHSHSLKYQEISRLEKIYRDMVLFAIQMLLCRQRKECDEPHIPSGIELVLGQNNNRKYRPV